MEEAKHTERGTRRLIRRMDRRMAHVRHQGSSLQVVQLGDGRALDDSHLSSPVRRVGVRPRPSTSHDFRKQRLHSYMTSPGDISTSPRQETSSKLFVRPPSRGQITRLIGMARIHGTHGAHSGVQMDVVPHTHGQVTTAELEKEECMLVESGVSRAKDAQELSMSQKMWRPAELEQLGSGALFRKQLSQRTATPKLNIRSAPKVTSRWGVQLLSKMKSKEMESESSGRQEQGNQCIDVIKDFRFEELQGLQHCFEEAENQVLSLPNFLLSFETLQGHATPRQGLANLRSDTSFVQRATELFRRIDAGGRGFISWPEFCEHVIESQGLGTQTGNGGTLVSGPNRLQLSTEAIRVELPCLGELLERVIYLDHVHQWMVCRRDRGAFVYGGSAGKLQKRMKDTYILAAIGLPDSSRVITSGANRQLVLWDAATYVASKRGVCVNPQMCIAWVPVQSIETMKQDDSKKKVDPQATQTKMLWSGGPDGFVRIWTMDAAHIKEVCSIPRAHTDWVSDMVYLEDLGLVATASLDKSIKFWDVHTAVKAVKAVKAAAEYASLPARKSLTSIARQARLDKTGAGVGGWRTPKLVQTGHEKGVLSLAYCHRHRLLCSTGQDCDVFVWNPFVHGAQHRLKGHDVGLLGVVAVPDTSQVITADKGGMVRIWNLASFQCTQVLDARDDGSGTLANFTAFAYNAVQEQLITLANARLCLWPAARDSDSNLASLYPIEFALYNKMFHTIVVICSHEAIVWDAFAGKKTRSVGDVPVSAVSAAVFDQRERALLVGTCEGEVLSVDYVTGHRSWRFKSGDHEISGLCHLGVGRVGVGSSSGRGWVWGVAQASDPGPARRLLTFRVPHSKGTPCFACSPAARLLGLGGGDRSFHFWKTDSGNMFGALTVKRDIVACTFADEINVFVGIDGKATLTVYSVGNLRALVRVSLASKLDPEQIKRHPSSICSYCATANLLAVDVGGSDIVVIDMSALAKLFVDRCERDGIQNVSASHAMAVSALSGLSSISRSVKIGDEELISPTPRTTRLGTKKGVMDTPLFGLFSSPKVVFPQYAGDGLPAYGFRMPASSVIGRWDPPGAPIRSLSWTHPAAAIVVGCQMGHVTVWSPLGVLYGSLRRSKRGGRGKGWNYPLKRSMLREQERAVAQVALEKVEVELNQRMEKEQMIAVARASAQAEDAKQAAMDEMVKTSNMSRFHAKLAVIDAVREGQAMKEQESILESSQAEIEVEEMFAEVDVKQAAESNEKAERRRKLDALSPFFSDMRRLGFRAPMHVPPHMSGAHKHTKKHGVLLLEQEKIKHDPRYMRQRQAVKEAIQEATQRARRLVGDPVAVKAVQHRHTKSDESKAYTSEATSIRKSDHRVTYQPSVLYVRDGKSVGFRKEAALEAPVDRREPSGTAVAAVRAKIRKQQRQR